MAKCYIEMAKFEKDVIFLNMKKMFW